MPEFDLSSVGNSLKDMSSQVGDYFSKNPRLGRALTAGLGTAAIGGGLTAMSKRENESREERRKRILKNALMLGGMGAGAVGAGDYAIGQFNTIDSESTDPVLGGIRKYLAGGAGAGAAGLSYRKGLQAEHAKRMGVLKGIRDYSGDRDPKLKRMLENLDKADNTGKGLFSSMFGTHPTESRGIMNEVADYENQRGSGAFKDLATDAGATSDELLQSGHIDDLQGTDDLKRYAKEMGSRSSRRWLGPGGWRRAGRVGQIAGAAALPYALMSSVMGSPEMRRNDIGGLTSI